MKLNFGCTFVFIAGFLLPAYSFANVLSLFPIGNDAKSAAIESAIDSREPQTLLYNPAVLSLTKSGFNGEVGAGRLQYSYEHPSFDPVRVSLFAPVVSAGWRSDDMYISNFHWAIAIAPTSMTQLKIKGLPRRIDGAPTSLDVDTTRNQFHLPIGGSYSFNGDPRTSVGASLITTYDHKTLKASSIVDGGELVDMTSNGVFLRPEIGGVYGTGPVDVGVSYMAARTKRYTGKATVTPSKDPANTEQVDYDPAVLLTGIRGTCDAWTASFNVNRIFGSRGRSVIHDGINRNSESADVHDVNQLGARVAYQLDDVQSISAAYVYLPTIWGSGSYSVDADGFQHLELGHLFGTFNAMPVRNQAISWRYQGKDLDYNTVLFRTAGSQTVDLNGDNPGYYQIEFVSITTGITKAF